MPLSATNFVTKGPVMHQDMLNFFNLFTGVMTDQPVTFKNVLSVGGSQGTTTVPVKLYGAVGQTTHLLDLYTDNTNANPGWGIAASGNMGWGPGGAAPIDTTLSRVATQNGHSSDTAGLLVTPYLEVAGNISATTYMFPNSATITGPTANPFYLLINNTLEFQNNATLTGPTANSSYVLVNNTLAIATVNERFTYTSAGTASFNMISTDSIIVDSAYNGVQLSNALWNGTQWNRLRTDVASVVFNVNQVGLNLYVQAAGTAPITAWGAPIFSVPVTGFAILTQGLSMNGVGGTAAGGVGWGVLLNVNGLALAGVNSAGGQYALIGTTADNWTSIWSIGAGITFANAANSARIGSVDNTGNWNLTNSLTVYGPISISGVGTVQINATAFILTNDGSNAIMRSNGTYFMQNVAATVNYATFSSAGMTITGNGANFGGSLTINQNANSNGGITWNSHNGNNMNTFEENGHFYFWPSYSGANYYFQASVNAGWGICNAAAFTPQSARKTKANIHVLEDPLSYVLDDRLHAIRYDEKWSGKPRLGFVADDWVDVERSLVNFDDDGEVLALDYDRIGAITFEALKQYVIKTNARLDALERMAA